MAKRFSMISNRFNSILFLRCKRSERLVGEDGSEVYCFFGLEALPGTSGAIRKGVLLIPGPGIPPGRYFRLSQAAREWPWRPLPGLLHRARAAKPASRPLPRCQETP